MRLLTLICLLCFSCSNISDSPEQSVNASQVLKLNSRTEPMSLDPRKARDLPSATIVKMLFDGLMRYDANGKLSFALAKNVDISDDKKEYTFHLREAYWTNGQAVTANDFEYTWKKSLSPDYPSESIHPLYVIKNALQAKQGRVSTDEIGIYARDAETLVVTLEHPTPYFLELITHVSYYAVPSRVDQISPEWPNNAEKFVSNGPFSIMTWKHGNQIKVLKNQNYWDESAVELKGILISMIEDEHTELNMFENGELDWAGSPLSSIPPDAIESLKQDSQLCVSPMAEVYSFKFNTESYPFNNNKIRKAFSYAINRKKIIDNVSQGGQIPATGIIAPKDLKQRETPLFTDGDTETAKVLFDEGLLELGIETAEFPEIVLSYTKCEKHQKISQAVQQQWKQAFGIPVTLQAYEWNAYLSIIKKHQFQIAGVGCVVEVNDPQQYLLPYKYRNEFSLGYSNDTQWENPEYKRLLDLADECTDTEERLSYLFAAEEILIDQMPIAPLLHAANCYVVQDRIKGIILTDTCHFDFKWARIQ